MNHPKYLVYTSAAMLALGSSLAVAQDQKNKEPQSQEAQGATIKLDRKAPEINYKPAQPKITVTVPPPKVTVNQPAPQIQVTMPKPDVQIEQQDPQVDVEMGKPDISFVGDKQKPKINAQKVQPDVQVKRQGKPQITVQSSDPQVKVVRRQSQDKSKSQSQSQSQSQSLMDMKGQQIKGQSLMDSENKEVGSISDLVQEKQTKKLFAVVKRPQGMKVVPVSDLKLSDQGNVQWSKTTDQMQQAQSYEKQQYQPIVLDQPLSKFQAD